MKSVRVFCLGVLLLLAGCGLGSVDDQSHSSPRPAPVDDQRVAEGAQNHSPSSPDQSSPEIGEADTIAKQIEQMSLTEKIGQMVFVGFEGETIDVLQTREMITAHKVGGFILFKRNIKDVQQTVGLLNSLKELNQQNSVPLFLGVDEEGGRVSRLPDSFVKLPASQWIGQRNDPQFSYQVGEMLGMQLGSLGFNVNFAPVLDVNSNPNNPVIGDRSFGNDPALVSELGIATMNGIASQHVIPVIKHFPGHGDTDVDSHLGLPIIHHDLERLREVELVPFVEAIQQGADAVMVAHILLPKLDEQLPASLSGKVINELLRKELQFDGVVISDDMTMGAIVQGYDLGEAAVKAVLAGTDIVLVGHEYEQQLAVIGALQQAAETGVLSEQRIDESLARILSLKQKYGLADQKVDKVEIDAINQATRELIGAK